MARYSDTQIIQLITKAARRVNRDLCLFGTADEIVINNAGELSQPANDDGKLEDMVLLSTECLVSQRDFSSDLNDGGLGLRVTDGEQTLDAKSKAVARADFFNSDFSPCAKYEKEVLQEKLKRSGSFGINVW